MDDRQLGNYRILQKIGEGGMGTVFLGRDMGLEREVVIKVISPQWARNPRLMKRFKVEAIAQARLNHPGIVTIHSFEQQGDTYFIVMEYVEGKTLKQLLKERGRIPPPEALSMIDGLLEGLAYAHGKGVLHRDVKPANIFVTAGGRVKIGDFGIAKVVGIDGLTRVGTMVGTPLYSSPEQIRGEKAGPASDIYSVGVMLYEMVTGTHPFSGARTDYEIQRAHLQTVPPAPATVIGDISAPLDAAIMKCLEKSTVKRFQEPLVFQQHLQRLGQQAGTPPGQPAAPGDVYRPRLAFPTQWKHTPGRMASAIGARIKNWSLSLTPGSAKKKQPSPLPGPASGSSPGTSPLEDPRKRKLIILVILIPILLLLLIIVANAAVEPRSKNVCSVNNIKKTYRPAAGRTLCLRVKEATQRRHP